MTAALVPFEPSRPDGRSDRQVVYDLVKTAEPDTMFTFDEIAKALNAGLDSPVTMRRVYTAVAAANLTLLKEQRRNLRVSRGRGYRVTQTSEAVELAGERRMRARKNLKRGVELLRHARIEELDPAQRQLHEGQLLIMAGLYQVTVQHERRHDRSESLIQQLTSRVERLEQPPDEATS